MKRQSRNKKFSANLEDINFGLKKLQNLPGRVEIFLEAQEFIFKLKFLQRNIFYHSAHDSHISLSSFSWYISQATSYENRAEIERFKTADCILHSPSRVKGHFIWSEDKKNS